jgi:hypothetical protein
MEIRIIHLCHVQYSETQCSLLLSVAATATAAGTTTITAENYHFCQEYTAL